MNTKAKRYISLLLLLLYGGALIFAQLPDYHVQMIMQKKGLSNPSQIREVMKDSKGFLWLMLTSKVQRFDGKNFVSFSFDEVCVNVVQDEEGVVWVATRQGIYRFKNDYSGFEELTEYRSLTIKYRRLITGSDKKIYLLSSEGITRWSKQAKKFELFGITPFRSTSSFPSLKNFGDWLFYKQNDTTLARYNVVTGAHDAVRVMDANFVIPLNSDSVWSRQLIGNTVLVSFKAKTTTPVTGGQFDEPLSGNSYFITGSIRRSPGEYLVLLNDNGCFLYNASKNRFSKTNFFYNGRLVIGTPLPISNNFYQEGNGTAWVANKDGLMYFNPLANGLNLFSSNGKWDNDIRNFAEDQQGNIWFGTANGFCKWDKHSGKVSVWVPDYDADNYLNYSSVRSIAFSSGKILIGQSEKGFWIFDPLTTKFTRPKFEVDSLQKRFERDFNHNMVKLRNGNFLLLSNRTWLVRKGVLTAREIKLPDSIGSSRAGYEDAQGRIWLLTGRGIFALDSNFKELYRLIDHDRGRWVNSIVQIDDTTFWAAAKNIFEIKLRAQKKLSIRLIFPELSEVHFSHLFKDSLQRIWMCNDEGIYRYIPETGAIEKFDHNDNAKGFYLNVSNSFRGSDGTVYFGSLNGINYFVPEKIPLQKDSLQLHLLNVTVNQDDSSFLLYRTLANLNYYQNSFVFNFIAPYVYNGEKVQYRYKLEGADKDWILLGNNSSTRFTSLQPGKYSFYAAASLNGKDWFPLAQPFSVRINPPFWQTWWFVTLAITSCCLLAIWLFRRRIAVIKARADVQQQLMGLEIRALRSQMNPHFIFNSLNSIAQLVASKQNEEGLQYLSKFSKLLRLVLDESEHSFICLKDEIKIMDLYLQLETLRFGSSFSYTIHADESLDEEETLIPSFLIHPIIENAIWHGLLHKEGERRLIISFRKNSNDKLVCIVKDNGIGIEAATLKKQQQLNGEKRDSKGLKMVKERLVLLAGQKNVYTDFRMEDMKDHNGYISGTKCTLELPVIYE